jgi:hypothetical protein
MVADGVGVGLDRNAPADQALALEPGDEVVERKLDPASAASAILARGAVDASDAAREGRYGAAQTASPP